MNALKNGSQELRGWLQKFAQNGQGLEENVEQSLILDIA
jgi:hypothetical protein